MGDYQSMSDGQLLATAREGDQAAFGWLVDRHKDTLVGYLFRLTGSRERAEDLAQESFLRLYEQRGNYSEKGRFSGYLYRIALNLLRSEERQKKRRRLLRSVFFTPNGHQPASQQRLVIENEVQRKVARAIENLPLKFRVPLVLHEVEGWSYREISALEGCREGTVKSRIHRGRRLLKERLSEYWLGGSEA